MRVLIAFDESSHSQYLINAVAKRKWPADTHFNIVSVIEPPKMVSHDAEWFNLSDQIYEKRKAHMKTLCKNACSAIEKHLPGCTVVSEIREGDPCCGIINASLNWQADKIVMGAHSRSVCPHNILGSVSRAVSHHAPCSVEVVREKVGEECASHSQA